MSNSTYLTPFELEDNYSWQFAALLLSIAPHALLLLLISPIIVHKLCQLGNKQRRKDPYQWVRFPGHNLRWVLSLVLLYILILETAEPILFDIRSGDWRIFIHVHNGLAILATIFTLMLNDYCESANIPKWLASLLLYWTCVVISRSLRLTSLLLDEFTSEHICVWLCGVVLGLSVILMLVDLHVMRKMNYLFHDCIRLHPPEELHHLKYVHPYTSLLSRATWHWLNPTLARGYDTPLDLRYLGRLPKTEHSRLNYNKFKTIWDEEKAKASHSNKKPSLWRCVSRCYWQPLVLAGFFKFIADIATFVGPITLDFIVRYVVDVTEVKVTGNTTSSRISAEPFFVGEFFSHGYVLTLLILGATILQGTMFQNNSFLCVRQGIRLKGALQALVFDKTLKLSTFSLGEGGLTAGQVMNHMAIDTLHLFHFIYFIHFIWSLPFCVALALILLYIQLGVSALIAAGVLVILVPVQYLVGQHLAKVQKKVLETADQRLKQCNELLQSMKLLKLYAWELTFLNHIEETRRKEVKYLLKAALCRVISILITDGAPLGAAMLTFSMYPYIENKPLQASKIFSGLALFNIMGLPLYLVTLIINIVTHAKISSDRILSFLLSPEAESAQQVTMATEKEGFTQKVPEVTFNGKKPPHSSTVGQPLLAADTTHNGQPMTYVLCEQPAALLNEENVLEVTDGQFSWNIDGKDVTLKNINLQVKKGELVMIVGSVGSGKSSLLSAIMGEMTTVGGRVAICGNSSVAYGGQKAWLLNDTFKGNILFGKEMDKTRYNKVLDVCALRPDIAMLPGGDMTEIGEKGINLSGGQKQRISIARCLYAGVDLVLLDDPLSALDVHVGSQIFNEAIMQFLIDDGKTVILVTHQLQYMSKAHKVVVMRDCSIWQQGRLEELSGLGTDMIQDWKDALPAASDDEFVVTFIEACISPGKQKSPNDKHFRKGSVSSDQKAKSFHSLKQGCLSDTDYTPGIVQRARLTLSMQSLPTSDDFEVPYINEKSLSMTSLASLASAKKSVVSTDELGQLIEEESRMYGSVSCKVYLTYAKAATGFLTFMALVLYLVRQALRMGADFWLAEWSEQSHLAELYSENMLNNETTNSTAAPASYDLSHYVTWYQVMCSVGILLGLLAIILLELMCLRAALNLHKGMLHAIVQAPMRFFDTTPLGRIINRFAGDTNVIDEKMPVIVDGVLFCLFFVLGGLVVNAVSMPLFLLPAIPMFAVYLAIQRYYIASSRELQRLDCLTKSPILSHFSETLGGLTTIRAYKDQKRFKAQNAKFIDDNNTAFLYVHTANVWMGIRLDYLGAAIVFTASVCSVTSCIYGYATPGVVGLAIAYAIMISGFVNWLMRTVSEAEMYFTSVERVAEFTNIEAEPQYQDEEVELLSDWPSQGAVTFEDVSLRYHHSLDPVMSGLSLEIKPGEKIGVCGRTGSGKSSTMLALFRMIDICQGRVLIDDIDICHVSLQTLRSRLAIIPQDPVLFEGTVRYNLDPMGQHLDDEIWRALEIAQLKEVVTAIPDALNGNVTEGGENFSVGQRQLFCIARAFLRDARILVMDEATASIDMETDKLLQKVIATAFAGKTIFTIAHRVSTILNSDRVLVLSKGKIDELGTPQELLAANGTYASMVHDNK